MNSFKPTSERWTVKQKRLRLLRLKAHRLYEIWTQEQAAQKLGITKQMLSAYETGKRIPTSKKAYEMASVLGLIPEMAVLLAINDELKANRLPIQVQLAS